MVSIMSLFAVILLGRLFVLQIVRGTTYQDNYNLLTEKTETTDATRGNIYDRNGELLAYSELAYAVTIEDKFSNYSTDEKNEILNEILYEIITNLNANGDDIDNDFGIYINSAGEYTFSSSGTALQRFRADIFGYSTIDELKSKSKSSYNIDEANATADEIMSYLYGEKRYEISEDYDEEIRYKIAVIRYNMSLNNYQKYISTTIASDISDESVAYIKEHEADFTGVEVEEQSVRRYVDSECFSNIIGYTGKISTEEYEELSEDSDDYTLNDIIGKSGIEQYMNEYLSGDKGYNVVYVDNVGNVLKEAESKDAVSGGDVYLSIDKDLTVATYNLLEQEIAGILYSKIQNIKEYNVSSSDDDSSSNIVIPIYDVYYALINNNLIDISALNTDDSSDVEKQVYATYTSKYESVISQLQSVLLSDSPEAYNALTEEYQEYSTYIVKTLRSNDVLLSDSIDSTDEVYQKWTNEELSVEEYLKYCIENDWIDITVFTQKSLYVDTDEIYESLVDYIVSTVLSTNDFGKLVYQYAILNDEITGNQLCTILYDQGFLEWDEDTRNSLASGSTSSYSFLKEKIRTLEITPGDLALDPCSGSCVVIDPNNGDVLACVSYPGYDSNKLANSVDSSYYSQLVYNQSNPLYNHATQQRTAPGSTFKMVSSVAGLAENVITTTSTITDLGVFDKVSNQPKCWYYPSTHGSINVSEALRDSCNYFFYEVGWELAGGSNYNDETGIKKIQKYASMFGLDEKTGVEIEENTPSIATEYPVMAAIGQSDNNFTTISLARYVTAIANNGTVYNLSLLDHVTDSEGNTLEEYSSEVVNTVDVLDTSEWNAIHYGMRMVVESLECFDGFSVEVAGKTGTAQQVTTRPNHALFVGFAPYSNPEVAVATRIAFGYTSHNAAEVTKDILSAYFGVEDTDTLLSGEAADNSSTNAVTD
ncbi:MAG: peptidoglycan glycosyltransferase [Lachnospiraceae bacterium]|nr:peptidoglycan glycosyltransferase [Lachnospiraceae bacterium]